MDIVEIIIAGMWEVILGIGIGLYQQDSYLEYLVKENLIHIPNLIKKINKVDRPKIVNGYR